ncbi:MAG: DUF2264 domain-containing protein [Bryobacteraceae bacterium]
MDSSRRAFLATAAAASVAHPGAIAAEAAASERDYWIGVLTRIADPLLSALSLRKLAAAMPVEAPLGNAGERRLYTHLEAFGRLLAGIAPWLESGDGAGHEGDLRQRYADLARQSIAAAVDPSSPDRMNFTHGGQPLVDTAFLALGVLRAPTQLWQKLDAGTRHHLIDALRSTRAISPGFSNWLLFSATIEAFLAWAGEPWDAIRIDYAVRQHEQWYKGDGVYGDGPEFHCDYYNSFVIHPLLLQVVETIAAVSKNWDSFRPAIVARARRHAGVLERLIGPDGTFPPIGRSLAYRCGAFHLLAGMALRRGLPDGIMPEQVRAALGAVMRRMMEAPGTFDPNGWLTVGFCGHQPGVAERYISTGSLYLCSTVLLPLGLASTDRFWSGPAQPWTSRRIWSGQAVAPDHALPDATPPGEKS